MHQSRAETLIECHGQSSPVENRTPALRAAVLSEERQLAWEAYKEGGSWNILVLLQLTKVS